MSDISGNKISIEVNRKKVGFDLAMCLIAGPRDNVLVGKAFNYVLGPHALEFLKVHTHTHTSTVKFRGKLLSFICWNLRTHKVETAEESFKRSCSHLLRDSFIF